MNKGTLLASTLCLLLGLVYAATGHGAHSHTQREHRHFDPKDSYYGSILKDRRLVQDREHLKEELPDHLREDDVDNMTSEELEYMYFRNHDADRNNRLDGLEILSAIIHTVQQPARSDEGIPAHEREALRHKRIETFHKHIEDIEAIVDEMMKSHDLNNDGYITYYEYRRARKI